STSYIAASQLKATCDQGLIVNGAFIANQVKFLRTNGNIATAGINELWPGGGNNNIAETFKAGAELYLSAPEQLKKAGSGKTNYNSITSLPPVL
ncbi:MAG: hypothetical protein ABIQ89_01670, partial [Candidatus Saccharimonadales bacterium]